MARAKIEKEVDRLGGDDARQLVETLSPQGIALGVQATPLRVGEPKTMPAELLAEDPVLLLEVGDDILLLPIDPASEGQQEKLASS